MTDNFDLIGIVRKTRDYAAKEGREIDFAQTSVKLYRDKPKEKSQCEKPHVPKYTSSRMLFFGLLDHHRLCVSRAPSGRCELDRD